MSTTMPPPVAFAATSISLPLSGSLSGPLPGPRPLPPFRMPATGAPPAPAPRAAMVEIGGEVVAVLRFQAPRRVAPAATIGGAPTVPLTEAEHEVMQAIFAGKSNDAIAKERGRSARTVANQIASIFKKHRVGSRSELVARYVGGGCA